MDKFIFSLAFSCTVLWGVAGAMFYGGGGFWGIVPLLISAPTGIEYARRVYPFWEVNAQPKNRAFVYQFTAIFQFTVGLILLVVKMWLAQLVNKTWTISDPVLRTAEVSSIAASIPIFLFAAYNIYVSQKIRLLIGANKFSPKQIAEEVAKVTTGCLANEKDLRGAGCFENDGFFMGAHNGKPVFLRDAVHLITYGGPGSGKSIGCVIPNILNWPDSMFITDPKGELSITTAEHRRRMGQEVVFLNPWELFGVTNTVYNPLSVLLKDMENSRDPKAHPSLQKREVADARVIAQILLPEPTQGDQTNKWVRDGGREMLEAFMLHFAANKPHLCSLIGLNTAINYKNEDYVQSLKEMRDSREFGGTLGNYGNSLCNSFDYASEQHQNYRNEAAQAVRLYNGYGPIGKAVAAKGKFDMERLAKKPTTIYLTIPGEQRDAYQAWMRLIVTIAVETIGRNGNGQKPCLFMLDEFANLGKLTNIQKGLAEYRGSGLRGWLIVQDRAQLESVYPGPEAKAVENLCDVTQILDCKFDHATELSDRLGQKGVVRNSVMEGARFDRAYKESQRTVQIEQKPIMVANEIMNLGTKQLVFSKALKAPLHIDKCPYWEADPWRDQVAANPLETTGTRRKPGPAALKIPTRKPKP